VAFPIARGQNQDFFHESLGGIAGVCPHLIPLPEGEEDAKCQVREPSAARRSKLMDIYPRQSKVPAE
jgi:hypothetical protein